MKKIKLFWQLVRMFGIRNTLKVVGAIRKLIKTIRKEERKVKKGWLTSKTVWFGALNVVCAIAGTVHAPTGEWLKAHVIELQAIIGAIVVFLRSITGKPLSTDPT